MTVEIRITGSNWEEAVADIQGLAGATRVTVVTPEVVTPEVVTPEVVTPEPEVDLMEGLDEPDHDINGDLFDPLIHLNKKTAKGVWAKKPVRKPKPPAVVETAPVPTVATLPVETPTLPVETPTTTQVEATTPAVVTPATGAVPNFGDVMKVYVQLDCIDAGKSGMAQIATDFGLASLPDVSKAENRAMIAPLFDALTALQTQVCG